MLRAAALASAPFTCLMYHSLSDGRCPDTQYLKYTTTRARFRDHLRDLRGAGFCLATAADLLGRLGEGDAPPSRYCVLTLDDGHRSALDMAEVMLEAGVRGTFFLAMDYCRERADFLKPPEIRALADQGFDFGTHGVTHCSLVHMPAERMRAELDTSREWLTDVLGRPVDAMTIPTGERTDALIRTAWEVGYRFVGNSVEQMNRIGSLPAEINRFVILAHHDAADVRRIASGDPAYILWRRVRQKLLYLPTRMLRPYDEVRA